MIIKLTLIPGNSLYEIIFIALQWARHAVDFHQEMSSANSRSEVQLCSTKAMELRAFHFVACHQRKRARQLWLRERLPATFFTHYNLIWLSHGTILELAGPPEHQAETQTEWQREMHGETSLPLCLVLLLFSCMFDTANLSLAVLTCYYSEVLGQGSLKVFQGITDCCWTHMSLCAHRFTIGGLVHAAPSEKQSSPEACVIGMVEWTHFLFFFFMHAHIHFTVGESVITILYE